jgi:hypothetical protein
MGFIDDKTQAINNVALFEVLNNLPKSKVTSSLDSVKSKNKNLLPFLIDLLSTTCKDNAKNPKDKAKCEATRILLEILVEYFPVLLKILKEGLAKAIKAGLACGTDFKLPTFNVKLKLNILELDFNKMLQQSPLSQVGSLLYGKDATKDLNWFLNNLIQSGGSGAWKGIVNFNYNQTTQDMEIGINPSYASGGGGKTFDGFINDFINSIELITMEQFMARLTDSLTGVLSAAMNTSLDQIISMEQVSKLQDNINNSDPCREDYKIDESYFTFSNDEMLEMEVIANQKINGTVMLDLGCGMVSSTIPTTVVKNIFDEIRNTPPSKVSAVIEKSLNSVNDNLTKNVGEENKKLAKLNLNVKFIEQIPKILTNIILEPKLVALYQLCTKLVNGPLSPLTPPVGSGAPIGVDIDAKIKVPKGFDYAKATSVFFEFVAREALAALMEIVFRKIKEEIMRLVADFAAKIVKEQANIRIKAIASITAGITSGLISTIPIPNTSEYT